MNILDTMIPPVVFSSEEQSILERLLTNDLLQRYFRSLAREEAKNLTGLYALGLTDQEIVRRHCNVQGKIEVLNTLTSLSVKE